MKLKMKNGAVTKEYTLTSAYPKPYLRVSNSVLPLTTSTSQGLQLKAKIGNQTYRAMEFLSSSTSATYETTQVASAGLSSTTALTRASTSGTNYGTRAKTTSTSYQTRISTSGTNYGTRASTSNTAYLTRASTSGTNYGTRASTSDTQYGTRASTSSTVYGTRISTTNTSYGTSNSLVSSLWVRYWTNKYETDQGNTSGSTYATRNFHYGNIISSSSHTGYDYGSITLGCSTTFDSYIRSSTVAYTYRTYGREDVTNSYSTSATGSDGYAVVYANLGVSAGTWSITSTSGNQGHATTWQTVDGYNYTSSFYGAWNTMDVGGWIYTRSSDYIVISVENSYQTITTGTTYYTQVQTTGTTYLTNISTSGTTYLTRSSTSGTTYLTRVSTSGTSYLTRVSTSGTTYLTRASTSNTVYLTAAETTGTTYLTRASTSAYSGISSSSSSISTWQ